MIRSKLVRLAALVCTLLMIASAAMAAPQWPDKIRVGLIPTEGGADIIKRFKPLVDHLENSLGIAVEPFSASDYAGIITAMAHKHIDFAYFGPKATWKRRPGPMPRPWPWNWTRPAPGATTA